MEDFYEDNHKLLILCLFVFSLQVQSLEYQFNLDTYTSPSEAKEYIKRSREF